jgi:serine/threonine protein kinase
LAAFFIFSEIKNKEKEIQQRSMTEFELGDYTRPLDDEAVEKENRPVSEKVQYFQKILATACYVQDAELVDESTDSMQCRLYFVGCFRGKTAFVKVVYFGQSLGTKQAKLFQTEIGALRCLKHPNIVSFYHACTIYYEKAMYGVLVEEYAEGQSADEYDEATRVAFAKPLLIALLETVQFMHRQFYLYTDLKFENFRICWRNGKLTLKLFDFDHVLPLINNCALVRGTPYCVDPSLCRGVAKYSEKVDIWNVGACIYYLFTSRFPCVVDDPDMSVREALNHAREWNGVVVGGAQCGELEPVILNMLQLRQDQRLPIDVLLGLIPK